MSSQHCVDQQVREVIDRSPGSILEEIVLESPDLMWNQVFVVINRLQGRSQYAIHLSASHHTTSVTAPMCE